MQGNMKIIRVTDFNQLEQCFAIRTEVFVEEQKVPKDVEIDEKDESPDACHHLLLLEEGEPVATGRWYPYKPHTAKLQRVAVLKKHRGKGLGQKLILAMEEQAKELGFTTSILDGQCHAENFYVKLGYAITSTEPFYDAGILHHRMEKKL
jgi:predicted GNAT family N-acyltransferase